MREKLAQLYPLSKKELALAFSFLWLSSLGVIGLINQINQLTSDEPTLRNTPGLPTDMAPQTPEVTSTPGVTDSTPATPEPVLAPTASAQ